MYIRISEYAGISENPLQIYQDMLTSISCGMSCNIDQVVMDFTDTPKELIWVHDGAEDPLPEGLDLTAALFAACRVTENEKPTIATNLTYRKEQMVRLYEKMPEMNPVDQLEDIERLGFYRPLFRELWNRKKPYLIID